MHRRVDGQDIPSLIHQQTEGQTRGLLPPADGAGAGAGAGVLTSFEHRAELSVTEGTKGVAWGCSPRIWMSPAWILDMFSQCIEYVNSVMHSICAIQIRKINPKLA